MTAYAAGLINKGKAEERIDILVGFIRDGVSKEILLKQFSEAEYEEAEKKGLVASSVN